MAKGTKTLNSAIKVDDDGNVYLSTKSDEPGDATLATTEVVYWVNESGMLRVKAKDEDGNVYVGDVSQLG